MAEFGGDKKGRHCVTTIKAPFTAVSACSQALVTLVIWLPTPPTQNRGGGPRIEKWCWQVQGTLVRSDIGRKNTLPDGGCTATHSKLKWVDWMDWVQLRKLVHLES